MTGPDTDAALVRAALTGYLAGGVDAMNSALAALDRLATSAEWTEGASRRERQAVLDYAQAAADRDRARSRAELAEQTNTRLREALELIATSRNVPTDAWRSIARAALAQDTEQGTPVGGYTYLDGERFGAEQENA